jgi:hypothetical protein
MTTDNFVVPWAERSFLTRCASGKEVGWKLKSDSGQSKLSDICTRKHENRRVNTILQIEAKMDSEISDIFYKYKYGFGFSSKYGYDFGHIHIQMISY